MGNQAFLRQLRTGQKKVIAESPTTIILYRIQSMVDDGFGGLIPNPDGTGGEPVAVAATVRISHERSNPASLSESSAGLSTNLQRFILSDWQTQIIEGDTFEAIDKTFKIGPVDPLIKFGGVYGYQAPLTEAEDATA